MSQLDQLPPDQRAALSLILRQQRSYGDVARLLRIEPEAVRDRALEALRSLGPRDTGGLPDDRRDEIADYLLGQQPASRRGETREYLEESPAGRAWGRVVSSELRPLSAGALAEIPGEGFERDPEPADEDEDEDEPAEPPAPAAVSSSARSARGSRTFDPASGPRAVSAGRQSPRFGIPGRGRRRPAGGGAGASGGLAAPVRRSRVGQAVLLLGLGVIVAAVIILILEGAFSSGGATSNSADNATVGSSSSTPATSTSTSSTATSTPKIVAQIQFTPTSGAPHAAAIANIAQQGNQKAFALVAQGLAPTKHFAYAVWMSNPGGASQPLGFINQAVGADGRAAAEGVLPASASQFKQILITQETSSKPTRPGTIVLVGRLNP